MPFTQGDVMLCYVVGTATRRTPLLILTDVMVDPNTTLRKGAHNDAKLESFVISQ